MVQGSVGTSTSRLMRTVFTYGICFAYHHHGKSRIYAKLLNHPPHIFFKVLAVTMSLVTLDAEEVVGSDLDGDHGRINNYFISPKTYLGVTILVMAAAPPILIRSPTKNGKSPMETRVIMPG